MTAPHPGAAAGESAPKDAKARKPIKCPQVPARRAADSGRTRGEAGPARTAVQAPEARGRGSDWPVQSSTGGGQGERG